MAKMAMRSLPFAISFLVDKMHCDARSKIEQLLLEAVGVAREGGLREHALLLALLLERSRAGLPMLAANNGYWARR
jgi:hypothetical protein